MAANQPPADAWSTLVEEAHLPKGSVAQALVERHKKDLTVGPQATRVGGGTHPRRSPRRLSYRAAQVRGRPPPHVLPSCQGN